MLSQPSHPAKAVHPKDNTTDVRAIHPRTGVVPEWQRLLRAPWLAARMSSATPGRVRDLYVAGLISARSMEIEAIHLLSQQIELLSCRSGMLDMLCRHQAESELQYERLGFLLKEMGVGTSPDSPAEPVAGSQHATAEDAGELLKMAIAIDGFEHREAAFYHALLRLSQIARHSHGAELLQHSLGEEVRMAAWARDNLDAFARVGGAPHPPGRPGP
jgi:ferritin-like metal-binding protein YciE